MNAANGERAAFPRCAVLSRRCFVLVSRKDFHGSGFVTRPVTFTGRITLNMGHMEYMEER